METRIGEFIFVHPFYEYGGMLHIPESVINKIGVMKILDIFKDIYHGSLPMSHTKEDSGCYRIEFPVRTSIEKIKEFVDRVNEMAK